MPVDDRLTQVLKDAGFKADAALARQLDADAEADPARRSEAAPYEVLGVFRKGPVTVSFEQNTQLGQTMPSVAVVENTDTGARVAVGPDDRDAPGLLASMVALAAGDDSLERARQERADFAALGFKPENGDANTLVRGATRVTLGLLLTILPTMAVRVLMPVLAVVAPGFFFDTYKKKLLDAVYGNTAVGAPATTYIALSTSTPTQAAGNITEPVGNAYARVAKTNDATNWPGATTADPSVKGNGTVITFPQATGSWGTVTHWVVYDALTVGNAIDCAALTAGQAISNGTTASFAVNALQSTLDG